MSKPKTLGVLVEQVPGVPATYRAGVVWGAMPFLFGVEEGPTPEAAVAALGGAARRLGYDPTLVIFDNLEAAQAEGRRRLAADDVSRTLDHARVRLPEVLAGKGNEPDARDREALDELDRAIRAVATGEYEAEKRAATPPIRDGRIVCPNADCDPDYPGLYFTATADALATAYLSPTGGVLKTWKNVSVSDEGYREVRCGACGAEVGDLALEDLQALENHPTEEE